MSEWNADKIIDNLLSTSSKGISLGQIETELATLIHAAIQDRVENEIVRKHGRHSVLIGENVKETLEASETPEVSRKCPFCGKYVDEHYFLAEHISTHHPEEAMKKYKEDIEFYYHHPDETAQRFLQVTPLMSPNSPTDDEKFCPFCEKPVPERLLKRHVVQEHGPFMEIFREVIKDE